MAKVFDGPTKALELGARIKTMVDAFDSIKEASAIAGVSRDQIYRYMSGETKPSFHAVARMAEIADVSLDWLWHGEPPMKRSDVVQGLAMAKAAAEAPDHLLCDPDMSRIIRETLKNTPLPDQMVRVPILNIEAALGPPLEQDREKVVDWAVIYKPKVPHPSHTVVVRVAGESMSPVLSDGFLVGVDFHPDALAPVEKLNAAMVLAVVDGPETGPTIKWCSVTRRTLTLYAENPASGFTPLAIPIEEAGRIKGVVRWWWGER